MANKVWIAATFTDTGTSPPIFIGGDFALNLLFASTGSVTLQRRGYEVDENGNTTAQDWVDVETYTADVAAKGEGGAEFEYRLNCTDATGDVTYWLGA